LLYFELLHGFTIIIIYIYIYIYIYILQEDASLVTNFSNKKLLVTIITNLDTSLHSKQIIGY